jgi:hypothetical protein
MINIYVIFLTSKKIIYLSKLDSFKIAGGYSSPWSMYYLTYFSIALLFAVIIIFILKLKYELKIKFLTAIISVIFTIFALELFLTLSHQKYNIETKIENAKKIGLEFDSRSTLDVLEALNQSKNKVYPNFKPKFFLVEDFYLKEGFQTINNGNIFPLSNISTILTNENGYYPIVKTDKYGFTNQNNFYNNNIDIMLIGDSYVEGYSVKPEDSISSNLNDAGYNSISLGKGGNGPIIELATLIEYAKPYKPPVVIWFFVHNDFRNLHFELRSNLLTNYLINTNYEQNLINKQNEIDDFLIRYIDSETEEFKKNIIVSKVNFLNLDTIIEIIKLSKLRSYIINTLMYLNTDNNYKILDQVLTRANNEIESWGGKLYFVYLPSLQTLNNTSLENGDKNSNINIKDGKVTIKNIHELCEKLNIEVIDFHNEISKIDNYKSIFPMESDGHYNSKKVIHY